MASITINGRTFSGDSVSIVDGAIIVDGVRQSGDPLSGVVRLHVEGVLGTLHADAPVTCGDAHGNVNASGPVKAGRIGGNVIASGPVTCGSVAGSVQAQGPVTHRP